ncbi:MAG TPA: nucleoside phosphorylase [Acidimicrobiales bacterium]|nr:nucleoside phosphorylase [Acidimicrobiales bacterium]
MARARFPILEHDPDPTALISPRPRKGRKGAPPCVVLCFFLEVIEEVCGQERAEEVTAFEWEHGRHPLFALQTDHGVVGVMHPGVGAPMAAGMLEGAIVSGGSHFVACGGAGAVTPGLALGHVVVPSAAVRDEGTSYHYLEPSREVELDAAVVGELVAVLVGHDVPYQVGKTWTTDAPYRETRSRISRRQEEGCVTVEMETAALAAVARFRQVSFGQYLYAGDDVSGEAWDHRGWNTHSSRRDLFWLAVEAATRLGGASARGS